jgi:hypothetical protein
VRSGALFGNAACGSCKVGCVSGECVAGLTGRGHCVCMLLGSIWRACVLLVAWVETEECLVAENCKARGVAGAKVECWLCSCGVSVSQQELGAWLVENT